MKRIRRVLYPPKSNAPWVSFMVATMFIVVAAVSLMAWSSQTSEQGPPNVPLRVQVASGSSNTNTTGSDPGLKLLTYSRWLNEDVVYIIDDDERAAFVRLSTNEERENFIVQFWERRNPSPGAAENTYKEEHYRRIAYANDKYAAGVFGWKTDRGRAYIVYGPPDSIESHRSGVPGMYEGRPFEVWIYEHAIGDGNDGSLTFVDRTRRGDYRLAPGRPQHLGADASVPEPPPTPFDVARARSENTLAVTAGTNANSVAASAMPDNGAAQPQRVRISEGVGEAMLVEKATPAYPPLARQAGIQGEVLMTAGIGVDGSVENLHVVSGHPMLIPAAIDAVKQWRYKPYFLDGSPVRVETPVRISFTLVSQN